jgi:hypothetical protein
VRAARAYRPLDSRLPEVRPLYHLAELCDASPAVPARIVEGENDADTLTAEGLLTTTASGGEGKARHGDCQALMSFV